MKINKKISRRAILKLGLQASSLLAINTSCSAFKEPLSGKQENKQTIIFNQNKLLWEPLYEPGPGGGVTSFGISPHDPDRVLVGGDMLGVALSEDGGERWQSTFGFHSWEIEEFTFHPNDSNIVWVGTRSGPYVSMDGGRNWEVRREGFPPMSRNRYTSPIQKVLFDPNNPDRLLAVGGCHRGWYGNRKKKKALWGAVWESLNGGNNWQLISIIDNGTDIVAASFASANSSVIYAAGRRLMRKEKGSSGEDRQGVYKSIDGGVSWRKSIHGLPHPYVHDMVVHPENENILWVALGNYEYVKNGRMKSLHGGIYKSIDGSDTWKPVLKGLSRHPAADYKVISIAPSNPAVLITFAWRSRHELYKSIDGGESWEKMIIKEVGSKYTAYKTTRTGGYSAFDIQIDPQNENRMFLGGISSMGRTLDGGKSWIDIGNYRPDPNKADWWRGRGFSGLGCRSFEFNPFDPKHAVFLAMDNGKFWQSRDNLFTWRWGGKGMRVNEGGFDVTFAGKKGEIMYAIFGQKGLEGIGKTIDGGMTWKMLAGSRHGLPKIDMDGYSKNIKPCSIHTLPKEPDIVWATIGGRLYMSENGGDFWKIIHKGPELGFIEASPDNPRSFYVSHPDGVYFTEDGLKFSLIKAPASWGYDPIKLDRSTPPRLYLVRRFATEKNGGLWRLESGRWTRIMKNISWTVQNVAIDPTDPDRIAVITDWNTVSDISHATGVWISEDGGKTWAQNNEGLPMLRGKCITINPHNPEQIVVGTSGRGFFVTRWTKK